MILQMLLTIVFGFGVLTLATVAHVMRSSNSGRQRYPALLRTSAGRGLHDDFGQTAARAAPALPSDRRDTRVRGECRNE